MMNVKGNFTNLIAKRFDSIYLSYPRNLVNRTITNMTEQNSRNGSKIWGDAKFFLKDHCLISTVFTLFTHILIPILENNSGLFERLQTVGGQAKFSWLPNMVIRSICGHIDVIRTSYGLQIVTL